MEGSAELKQGGLAKFLRRARCNFKMKRRDPAAAPRLLSLHRGCGNSFLRPAGEMRDDAEHALDKHQLPAMMHFVFLDGEEHVEAVSRGRRSSRRHRDDLREEIFIESFQPLGPL